MTSTLLAVRHTQSNNLHGTDGMLIAQIDYFRTIVNNLGTKNDGVLEIDFRCTDQRLVLERNFPTDTDPTGSQKSKMTFYPVDLTRISGRIQNAADSVWFLDDQLLIRVSDIRSSPSLAITFSFPIGTIEIQQRLTGSNKLWADIIMQGVLSDTAGNPKKGLFKDAVRDWSLETLTRERFSLFNIDPATITVMHELTHSIAIGMENVIGKHVIYNDKNVIGLKRVLEAAAGDVQGLTRNPDTLAYLALRQLPLPTSSTNITDEIASPTGAATGVELGTLVQGLNALQGSSSPTTIVGI
ncbi:hypothetical protein Egran_00035 [Elaphomyces granulatus]|uniref:Uncharacterized protein n=1 Tax=Elaphomyces granulatus TaxID=519963 RepID=A0A232M7E1_9EURO|nr:hypothetical protein Egran_00035 [Elaphomyces granulatus]